MPAGYSARFLFLLLAGHEPGERMSPRLVEALHAEIARQNAFGHGLVMISAEPYHVMERYLQGALARFRLSCDEDERMKKMANTSAKPRPENGTMETIDSRRDRQIEGLLKLRWNAKENPCGRNSGEPKGALRDCHKQEYKFFSSIQ